MLSMPGAAAQTAKKVSSASFQATSGSDFRRSLREISMILFFIMLSVKLFIYSTVRTAQLQTGYNDQFYYIAIIT